MTDGTRRMMWTGTLLAVALLVAGGGRVLAADVASVATAPGSGELSRAASQPASTDWPNFMGPNRNGVVEGGPKLLQKWPEKGPLLIWQSGPLPRAPQCGLGAPVVANGRVYTYADVALPVDGVFPFDDKTLLEDAGFAPDMPPDVVKAVDAVRFSDERKKLGDFLDLVNGPKDQLAKFEDMIQKLLASLDPTQAKKYEKVIRGRMRLGGEYGKDFGKNDWDWLAAHRKLEVKTSAEFIRVANSLGGDWDGGRVHAAHFMNLNSNAARIYKDQKWGDLLICLDAATGKKLWEQTCSGVVHGESGHEVRLSGTPAVADGRVFMRGSGGLHCLDAKEGKLLWEVQGPPGHNSPIVAGDVVYCYLPDLTALDARTGRKLWRQPALENEFKTPALWFHDGKKYVLGSDRGRYGSWTTCVDGDTGKILWRIEFPTEFQSPVISRDTLVLRGSKIVAYKLSPDKAEQLWSVPDFGDHGGSSPAIGNGYVYSVGNCYGGPAMQVLDLTSGKGSIHAYGTRAGTPIVADGMIFTMSDMAPKGEKRREDCPIMALKSTSDKYEEVGLIRFDKSKEDHRSEMDLSTLALADGRLYVRLNETIACYDLRAEKK